MGRSGRRDDRAGIAAARVSPRGLAQSAGGDAQVRPPRHGLPDDARVLACDRDWPPAERWHPRGDGHDIAGPDLATVRRAGRRVAGGPGFAHVGRWTTLIESPK